MRIDNVISNIASLLKGTAKDDSSAAAAFHSPTANNAISAGVGAGAGAGAGYDYIRGYHPLPHWTTPVSADGLLVYYDTHIQHYEINFAQYDENTDIHFDSLLLTPDIKIDDALIAANTDFSNLVWQDTDSNDTVEAGKILNLNNAGVLSIGLSYQDNAMDYANTHSEMTLHGALVFTYADGHQDLLSDVSFMQGEPITLPNVTDSMTDFDAAFSVDADGQASLDNASSTLSEPATSFNNSITTTFGEIAPLVSSGLAMTCSSTFGETVHMGIVDNGYNSSGDIMYTMDDFSMMEFGMTEDNASDMMTSMDDPSMTGFNTAEDNASDMMTTMDDPSMMESSVAENNSFMNTLDDSITQMAGAEDSLNEVNGQGEAYTLFSSSSLSDLMTQLSTENGADGVTLGEASDPSTTSETLQLAQLASADGTDTSSEALTMFGSPSIPIDLSELLNTNSEDSSTENTTTGALNSLLGETTESQTADDPSTAANPDQHAGSDTATTTSDAQSTSTNPADAAMLDVTAPNAIDTGSGSGGGESTGV